MIYSFDGTLTEATLLRATFELSLAPAPKVEDLELELNRVAPVLPVPILSRTPVALVLPGALVLIKDPADLPRDGDL